jgi:hypothetical protein
LKQVLGYYPDGGSLVVIATSRLTVHTCVQILLWGQNPNRFSNIAKKLQNCPFVTLK